MSKRDISRVSSAIPSAGSHSPSSQSARWTASSSSDSGPRHTSSSTRRGLPQPTMDIRLPRRCSLVSTAERWRTNIDQGCGDNRLRSRHTRRLRASACESFRGVYHRTGTLESLVCRQFDDGSGQPVRARASDRHSGVGAWLYRRGTRAALCGYRPIVIHPPRDFMCSRWIRS